MVTLTVNGTKVSVEAADDMPLLWVLRDLVGMTGTKFGCGIAQCGACTVHVDGEPRALCVSPIARCRRILDHDHRGDRADPRGQGGAEGLARSEVVQCGYCQSGQIMTAAALLANNPESRATRTSTSPWRATSAAAAPICASAKRSSSRPSPSPVREAEPWQVPSSCAIRPRFAARVFLKAGAAIGGGLMIGWVSAARMRQRDAQPFAPNAFLRIDRAGKVTFVCPAAEMGQGTYTSLPCLWPRNSTSRLIRSASSHSPPSDKLYGNPAVFSAQITGGSISVHGFFKPLREAGAAARQMLMSAAAARLERRCGELTTRPGQVVHAKSGQRHRLRRAGRRRRKAASADRRRAQGSSKIPHHRHAGQAARRSRQGRRHGRSTAST